MRINHAGEVCAQALYLGQAAVSRSADTRRHLLQAADEEADHLEQLPETDARSRAIVAVMQADEARHGANARAAGARELPAPLPRLMHAAADVMRWLAYRI